MKYYKDSQNRVYAYESDGSQDKYIPSNYISISLAEALALLGPNLTLDQLRAKATDRINRAYQAAVEDIIGIYPLAERESWPTQVAEAKAYIMDNNASTPWIDNASVVRGITKVDLVSRIIANNDAFTVLSGQLSGKRQKLKDQIDSLTASNTPQDFDAILW